MTPHISALKSENVMIATLNDTATRATTVPVSVKAVGEYCQTYFPNTHGKGAGSTCDLQDPDLKP